MAGNGAQGDAVIRTEKLVKEYGTSRVVDEVSVELRPGEIVGLLGPNGAGKSTTFKMLVGFTRPTSGRVYFGTKEISSLAIHQRARLGIGYLPQETSIFRHMTVRQNLIAVLQARGVPRKEISPRAKRLLKELGVDHLERRRVESSEGKLSGGEMRRVEIARALMTDPSFIFLDEPFTGVDPRTVEDIQGIIRTLRDKGLGILITDHNIRETLGITDRSYMMYEGKVVVEGTVAQILQNEVITKGFLTQRIVEDLSYRAEQS